MRYFTSVQYVAWADTGLIDKAWQFAVTTAETTADMYKKSKQADVMKIATDHFIGKLGEEAVYAVMSKYGQNINPPDYTVYQVDRKSWDADLKMDGVPLAVKTQRRESAEKWGLSWTFSAGKTRSDPILNEPDAWVVFTMLDTKTYIATVFPPYQIKELVFRPPLSKKMRPYKKVVYARELPVLT